MAIKNAIQQTRYNMIRSANREALALYYGVGGLLSYRIKIQMGQNTVSLSQKNRGILIGSLATDQLSEEQLEDFLTVQFSHHYELLVKTNTLDERLFYQSTKKEWMLRGDTVLYTPTATSAQDKNIF